jgi:DHA1 family multidrug resistance protein-like MFS transporter
MLAERWQQNLAVLFIGQLMMLVAFSFFFPFIPLYVQTLGVEGEKAAAQWAGVIAASNALSMIVFQPIWGNMADRVGRKPMVLRSMLGIAIFTALMGLATAPWQLVVLRFLQGSVAGSVPASNALVAAGTPKRRLGFALGLMQVAIFLGMSIGPLIGGVIADTVGYRDSFYAAAALMFLGAILVITLVHEDFSPSASTAKRRGVWSEARSQLSLPLFPMLIVVIFLIQFGGHIVSPVLSLFVADLSGGKNAATAAGAVLAATGIASAVFALILGRAGDRVGHPTVLTVCLLGAAISHFPQYFVQQVWQLLLLRTLTGCFLGGLMPSANAIIAGMVSRQRRGAAFGLMATANAAANAAGPLSGAYITAQWGMREVFLATGLLFTLTFGWPLASADTGSRCSSSR